MCCAFRAPLDQRSLQEPRRPFYGCAHLRGQGACVGERWVGLFVQFRANPRWISRSLMPRPSSARGFWHIRRKRAGKGVQNGLSRSPHALPCRRRFCKALRRHLHWFISYLVSPVDRRLLPQDSIRLELEIRTGGFVKYWVLSDLAF